jgi:hypothetical protein
VTAPDGGEPSGGGPPSGDEDGQPSRFRRTLASVMAVQVVTLLVLWLLQRHFSI